MSEILIFGFGSILFTITAAATFTFGLRRFHEIQMDDLAQSGRFPVDRPGGLTELHVDSEQAGVVAPGSEDPDVAD